MAAPRQMLSPKELAEYLGVPLATIYQWRYKGEGPRGIRVGRHVRFLSEDIASWLEEHADAAA